ncbi:MAG: choice-of-anchor D domain-containing protein [Deltaproteobacteria bacterium]|nr:MAG: choice-of-anchor D domain-containing protein [Deltaproteobacteria bacterium]
MSRPRLSSLPPFLTCALLLALAACSGLDERDPPQMQLSPGSILFEPTNLGDETSRTLIIRNVGSSPLRIERIETALTTDHVRTDFDGPRSLQADEEIPVRVFYAPTSVEETSGTINVFSNDPFNNPGQVAVTRIGPTPQLQVFPDPASFGTVAEGSSATLTLQLDNVGTAPLIICRAFTEVGGQFETDLDARIEQDDRTQDGRLILPPTEGENGIPFEATFRPIRLGPATGSLVVQYDRIGDPENPCEEANTASRIVELNGNGATSELTIDPCAPFIDFGETPFDATARRTIRLRNDQELDLRVFGAALVPGVSDPAFTIGARPDFPADLAPGAERTLELQFQPRRVGEEQSRAMAAILEVEHTDVEGERTTTRCDIAGLGVDRACPVAVGRAFVLEDPQVRRSDQISWAVPLQTLVLDASDSFSSDGLALEYEWSIVDQPNSAFAGLRPYTIQPENDAFRQFFMPIAGEYIFALRVFDADGFESCEEARVVVDATPDRTISVELTWRNPADPDENNNDGSDLDLHFLKVGPGQWFRAPYDVYFANRSPDWLPENPSLDIDVRNGLGPETITLDNPVDCQFYAIGVHYFDEAWGEAIATIRVYVDGQLAHEQSPGLLRAQNDFWDVGRLHWPSGEFFEVNEVIRNFDGANAAPVSPPSTAEIDALGEQNPCFAYP